ncbi:methyl-accepting chemotaxis protein, partial [candidate division GN15 bacterium]|nr:methyl-accepting chemotaxis protein [candidate division GN15 bacterium]
MFKNLKMNAKLITIFMLIGLIPLGAVALISVVKSQAALEEKAYNQLISLRDVKKGQIGSYFDERMSDVSVLATNPTVVEAMAAYEEGYEAPGGILSANYSAADERYSDWLTQYEKEYGYYDLFLIDDDGDIVYTVEKEPDFATNIVNGEYSSENLADLFRMSQSGTAMVD